MVDEHDSEPGPAGDTSPEAEPAGRRPKRTSVRPSAFGPPRASGSPADAGETPPSGEAADPADPFEGDDSSDTLDGLDPYELTPSTTPSAVELFSEEAAVDGSPDSTDGWTPLGARQNVFPTLGYDPFRSVDSQPPTPGRDPDSEEASLVSSPGFDETEVTSPSLVAARSGLLPIPEGPDESGPVEEVDEAGVGTLSVALFVLMLLGAGGVLVAQWWRVAHPREVAPAPARPVASKAPAPTAVPAPAVAPAVAVEPAEPPEPPRAVPAPLGEESADAIVAKVEPGLPEDGAAAAQKLFAYAQSYREDGRPEVAEALLLRALALSDRDEGTLLGLAELALERGALEQAEGFAARAVAADGRSVRARVLLGDVYAAQGHAARARRHWQRAQRLDPNASAVRARLEGP